MLENREESIGERERGSKVNEQYMKLLGRKYSLYLHGMSDAGTRLLFWSGTHGLNEELGKHRGREGRQESMLCGDECESVSHVLGECPTNSSIRQLTFCYSSRQALVVVIDA